MNADKFTRIIESATSAHIEIVGSFYYARSGSVVLKYDSGTGEAVIRTSGIDYDGLDLYDAIKFLALAEAVYDSVSMD